MERLAKTKKVPGILTGEGITVIEIGLRETKKFGRLIFDIFDEKKGMDVITAIERFEELIPDFTDIKKEQVEELKYSELLELYKAFREVNATFLLILKSLGMETEKLNKIETFLKEVEGQTQVEKDCPQNSQKEQEGPQSDKSPNAEQKSENGETDSSKNEMNGKNSSEKSTGERQP